MDYQIQQINNTAEKVDACKNITESLPEYFGIQSANEKYFKDAAELPAISVKYKNSNIALLVYKKIHDAELDKTVIDIHWLGILPEFHRKGFGKQLIEALVEIVKAQDIDTITVETLDPAMKDENYLRSFEFYKNLAFDIYHHFNYGKNLMVKMYRKL